MDSRSIVSGLFQANRQGGSDTVTSYQVIEKDEVRSLPIDALIPSKINRELDHDFVTELANNIRMNGLMQYPIDKADRGRNIYDPGRASPYSSL